MTSRDALLDGVDRAEHAAHVELDLAGDQQRPVGGLRAALADGDVEAVLRVGAVGDGLVEAAVLGLRQPVGAEGDLVLRQRRGGRSAAASMAPVMNSDFIA